MPIKKRQNLLAVRITFKRVHLQRLNQVVMRNYAGLRTTYVEILVRTLPYEALRPWLS